MKRLVCIVIFFCINAGLLTYGSAEKYPEGFEYIGTPQVTKPDTSLLEVSPFNLPIIPPSSGVQFYKNNIVFLSDSREEARMSPKHVSFGTIEAYTAQVEDSLTGKHTIFSQLSTFSYPCEAITFSSDYKTMYFTRIPKKEKNEKIYRAVLETNSKNQTGWIPDPEPLDFCRGDYSYANPTLSSDGKIMIFASDMQGTSGGMDLFLTRKDGDKWSVPENLGNTINTVRYEFFPFLDSENNLYFSSDGLTGLGGFDIFTCKFNGTTWEKPVNLSPKINTKDDDIAFSINKTDGKTAFYTVRKKSNETQLYKVSLNKKAEEGNALTISTVLNAPVQTKTAAISAPAVAQTNPPVPEPEKVIPPPEKKEEAITAPEKRTPEKKAPVQTAAEGNQPLAKVVEIKPTVPLPDKLKDVVIYRVQFLSSSKQRKENQIIVNGISFNIYEYFYLGAYRYTIGEFTTLAPALELQKVCRNSGYPQAFVAAFKNSTRSLDLKIFR